MAKATRKVMITCDDSDDDDEPIGAALKRKSTQALLAPQSKKSKTSLTKEVQIVEVPFVDEPASTAEVPASVQPIVDEASVDDPQQTIVASVLSYSSPPSSNALTVYTLPSPITLLKMRKRRSAIIGDAIPRASGPLPSQHSRAPRHPLLPSYLAADTDLYSVIFPASDDPAGRAVLLQSDHVTDDLAIIRQNRIGSRTKPRPYIKDRTINVLCGEYPISWPGRYVLQKPSASNWGYYQPMYSWVDERAYVTDSLGNPLHDSLGRSYRYTNFLSSRPTFGPEYYYLPHSPPPAPLSVLTKPPIFGLRLRPPPAPLSLAEAFTHPPSDYFLIQHYPAILNTTPHQPPPEPPLSPRKLAITPVLPVYEEGVYSCTSYMDDFFLNLPMTTRCCHLMLSPPFHHQHTNASSILDR
ncbi:hypothetical protein Fmac_008611 [Flemingia macrophylla]|uniref:Uncharacterized protein n=1 Tax=Flemingia macrophylla TaxID=520843 RepID=A0ABD1MXW8_9FABA